MLTRRGLRHTLELWLGRSRGRKIWFDLLNRGSYRRNWRDRLGERLERGEENSRNSINLKLRSRRHSLIRVMSRME
jgi:hypothetical protein